MEYPRASPRGTPWGPKGAGGNVDGLDERGLKILRFLARRESTGEGAPTMREVAAAAGLRSSRSGQQRLAALEEAGYVGCPPGPGRASRGTPQGSPRDSRRRSRRPVRLTGVGWGAVSEVPYLGGIAAGRAIEPIRRAGEVVPLGDFALRAEGDSMTNAGIADGDRLLFAQDPSPPDGAIVAALVGGESVTVKRLFRENGSVRLKPENAAYEDLVVPAEDVEVQGRLEWILRRPTR